MQALPQVTKSDVSKAVEEDSDGISIEITTVIGVTIPVIVRNGKLSSDLNFSNVRYVKSTEPNKKPYISLDMNRTGEQSTYGDLRVTFIDKSGKKEVVAIAKGVAVYTPNISRKFEIEVNVSNGKTYDKGRFHITYTETGKDETTGLIASAEIEL
jgi:hypothetical protein